MEHKQGYQTKNRKLIWEYVNAQKDAQFSANDIYRFFMVNGNLISLPTIYRQLDKMTEEGLLLKYRTVESDTALYYYPGEKSNNYQSFMKCTSCGQTFLLKCHTVEQMADHVWDQHHFQIELENTTLYGKCAQCMTLNHK